MKIKVDCTEKTGGDQYKYIVEKSIEDLGLGGNIDEVRLFIRLEDPVFILSIRFKEYIGRNTISELGSVDMRSGGVRITLDSEVDLGDTLKTLWTMYGRDKVEQAGRMEIMVNDVEPEVVKSIKIREKAIDISAKVNELASRIIPEGFRVRNATKGNGVMTFIAAEDPMKEEWKQIAASMEADA